MEINFEYHQTRLDVWINGHLAIEGVGLIGYEFHKRNNLDKLKDVKKIRISVSNPDIETKVFRFLDVDSEIVLKLSKKSCVTIMGAIVVYEKNCETLLY